MSKYPPMSDAQFVVFSGMTQGRLQGFSPEDTMLMVEPLHAGQPPINVAPIVQGMIDLTWITYCQQCKDPHPTPLGLHVYADALEKILAKDQSKAMPIQPAPTSRDPRRQVELITVDGLPVARVMILPFNESPEVLIWGDRVFVKDRPEDLSAAIPIRATYREAFTAIAASA